MAEQNTRVVLAARPTGVPERAHFAVDSVPVPDPGPGQFVVRAEVWSADPAQRGWALDVPNYLPPVEIGAPMRGFSAGRVIASRHPDYPEGARVSGMFGWQTHALSDGSEADGIFGFDDLPLSYALGVLGLNGLTAWVGLTRVLRMRSGETVTVSTAAGAVGSAVGQLAQARGVRAVGIAGGPEKCARAATEFGYAACVDYRAADF